MTQNANNRETASIRLKFLQSDESVIFVMGSCMLILWVGAIAVLWQMHRPEWYQMLTIGFAHMLAGRAASVAHATQYELHKALIAFFAVYLDVMIMFIVYPILIFSYKNLFERQFFKDHVRPVFDSARENIGRLRGFKIVGLFLFVWFPLWMTGIIVGSVIGYLMGLKTWVTMATVIVGAAAAIFMWVYAYDVFFGWLGEVNRGIPAVTTAVIILCLALLRFKGQRGRRQERVRDHG